MQNLIVKFTLLFILVFSVTARAVANDYGDFKTITFNNEQTLVVTPLNSARGIELLRTANYRNDFYSLIHHFEPQINPLYCGIASSVIILNALNKGNNEVASSKLFSTKKPQALGGGIIPFRSYTQAEFFNENTEIIKPKVVIDLQAKDENLERYDAGVTLTQLTSLLETYNLKVKKHHANKKLKKGLKEFKKHLKKTVNTADIYMLANFHGKSIGVLTNGHISPIVAYHHKFEEILIMDVASHKQPWYWVRIEPFYAAMQRLDGLVPRGYLIVSGY